MSEERTRKPAILLAVLLHRVILLKRGGGDATRALVARHRLVLELFLLGQPLSGVRTRALYFVWQH